LEDNEIDFTELKSSSEDAIKMLIFFFEPYYKQIEANGSLALIEMSLFELCRELVKVIEDIDAMLERMSSSSSSSSSFMIITKAFNNLFLSKSDHRQIQSSRSIIDTSRSIIAKAVNKFNTTFSFDTNLENHDSKEDNLTIDAVRDIGNSKFQEIVR